MIRSHKEVSVVVPIYNEKKEILRELFQNIQATLKTNYPHFEIVCVDDGSTRYNYNNLKELSSKFSEIRLIRFPKNRGQQRALLEGIRVAAGDAIITIDSDLEYDPNEIPKFLEKIKSGYDVVNGHRKNREWNSYLRLIATYLLNFLAGRITKRKIQDLTCPFKAFKKSVAAKVYENNLMKRFPLEFIVCHGQNIKEIEINYQQGIKRSSKYTFLKLVKELNLLSFFLLLHLLASLYGSRKDKK